MAYTYYFSQKQLELIEWVNRKNGERTPINKVKCEDGVFRRFTRKSQNDEAPNFDDAIIVHKGDKATVSHNGQEFVEE